MANYFVMPGQPVDSIPAYVLNLTFSGNYSINLNSLTISNNFFTQLQSLVLAASCFKDVSTFVINDLTKLESIRIGKRCFTINRWHKREEGFFRIANCPSLRHVEIDDGSFADYADFQLSDLNALQSIDFGKETFNYCNLDLKSK